MLNIPIVVAAYNRKDPLERLLYSLNKAKYTADVGLIISIDGGADNCEIADIANKFVWVYGEKQVITSEYNMGLRNHIMKCGQLTKHYDGIVLLEDDLYVSPYFYDYIIQAHKAYRSDGNIAGIALYSHRYNETACLPFIPIDDGYDVFFMQIACSWGQCWLTHQWEKFEEWYDSNQDLDLSLDVGIPPDVRLWPQSSWKKYYLKYITENNKYFVYPRISLATNFADPGVNHLGTNIHQVPLLYNDKEYRFSDINKSIAKYDAYCEIEPEALPIHVEELSVGKIEVDLYGMKNKADIASDYVITTQQLSGSVKTFGRKLKPHELNVCENVSGSEIRIGLKENMSDYGPFVLYRNKVNKDYMGTHDYFYQITKDHYKPTIQQNKILLFKRLYYKIRGILGGLRLILLRLVT